MTDVTHGAKAAQDPSTKGPLGQFKDFFRLHWTRHAPGADTPRWVLLLSYRAWLIALLFKMLGSSWDMSWHFRWQRDDLAPPHLLNSVGTAMVIVLVAIHTFTGMACDRRSLRLIQWGTGVFLIAAPLDVINHRVNGLDLTAWSPSHFLLFIGTALMIAGLIDGWLKTSPTADKARGVVLVGLWLFFLENVLFANGQQEYGTMELASCDQSGTFNTADCFAEPSLLQFAADQMGRPVDREAVIRFALPVPEWLYPVWGIGVAALVLAVANRTIGRTWAATTVAGLYVAYRALIWPLLLGGGFPTSTIPFYLVFVGLAVDVVRRLRLGALVEPLVAGVAVAGLGYAALAVQDALIVAPDSTYWTAPLTGAGVALAWWAGRPIAAWFTKRDETRAARTVAPAETEAETSA